MSILSSALAGLAGAVFGFGCFGTLFWANLHKDGHDGATAVDIAAAVLPLALAFTVPSLIVAAIAFSRPDHSTARTAFGVAGIVLLFPAYPVLLASAGLLTAGSSIIHRRFRLPRADVVAIAAGVATVVFAIVAEGARG